MNSFIPLPYCDDASFLSEAIEKLFDIVQDYVEAGLDFDFESIFEAGEQGITLEVYNRLIDIINAEIASHANEVSALY